MVLTLAAACSPPRPHSTRQFSTHTLQRNSVLHAFAAPGHAGVAHARLGRQAVARRAASSIATCLSTPRISTPRTARSTTSDNVKGYTGSRASTLRHASAARSSEGECHCPRRSPVGAATGSRRDRQPRGQRLTTSVQQPASRNQRCKPSPSKPSRQRSAQRRRDSSRSTVWRSSAPPATAHPVPTRSKRASRASV